MRYEKEMSLAGFLISSILLSPQIHFHGRAGGVEVEMKKTRVEICIEMGEKSNSTFSSSHPFTWWTEESCCTLLLRLHRSREYGLWADVLWRMVYI